MLETKWSDSHVGELGRGVSAMGVFFFPLLMVGAYLGFPGVGED